MCEYNPFELPNTTEIKMNHEIPMEEDNGYSLKEQQEQQQYELLHPTERQLMERLDREIKTEIENFRSFSKHFDGVFKEFK